MARRRQKGRKPDKAWHKRSAPKRFQKAVQVWPESERPSYDGAPTPLSQGHRKKNPHIDAL